MTDLRTSGMRRRVCVSCQTKFVPKRLDAVTCSNRCRMAEHRKRGARDRAEALFKTREQIARNTAQQGRALEHYWFWALLGNAEADDVGHKHIRFVGTTSGTLAVQGFRENDLPWPAPWQAALSRGWQELKYDPSAPESGEPKVLEAVVEAMQRKTLGSYIRRGYEKECQALLRSGLQKSDAVKRISLFTYDPLGLSSGYVAVPPPLAAYLSDREIFDWDPGDYRSEDTSISHGDGGAAELIAGGGYEVFRIDKGHSIPE